MKNLNLAVLLVFCAIFVHVNAWVGIIKADPKSDHHGDCYTTHKNIGALSVGEVKRIEGKCAIATCNANGDIRLTGCSPIHVMPPYILLPGDLSKPFPECCYTIIRPENNTDTQRNQELEPVVPNAVSLDLTVNQASNAL